jgi:hypothetical protein
VRDFDDVSDIPELLDAFEYAANPAHWQVERIRGGRGSGGQSLRIGTKTTWAALLYDKHAQEPLAPRGRLRFEAQLRRERLRTRWSEGFGGPFVKVGDLTEEGVQGMRRATFEAVGYDRTVTPVSELERVVFQDAGLKPQEAASLWAHLTTSAYAQRSNRRTRQKYAHMAAVYGLIPGRLESQIAGSRTTRLDFWGGTAARTRAADSSSSDGSGDSARAVG